MTIRNENTWKYTITIYNWLSLTTAYIIRRNGFGWPYFWEAPHSSELCIMPVCMRACMSMCMNVCLSVNLCVFICRDLEHVCMNNLGSSISTYTSLARRHHCKSNKHQRATQIFEAFHGISHARFWSYALFRVGHLLYSLVLHPFYKWATLSWSKKLFPHAQGTSQLPWMPGKWWKDAWNLEFPDSTSHMSQSNHPAPRWDTFTMCFTDGYANSLPEAQLPLLKHLFLLLGVPRWWPWSSEHLASAMLHFKSFAKTGLRDD